MTFVTIRAYSNLVPFTGSAINQMVVDTLNAEQDRLRCNVYTYCLMPNHIHFLISPRMDGSSVLAYTDQFKGKTTNSSWKLGWRGKLWQPRFFDQVVRSEDELRRIAVYILENPVRKSLTDSPNKWPWCGNFNELPLS